MKLSLVPLSSDSFRRGGGQSSLAITTVIDESITNIIAIDCLVLHQAMHTFNLAKQGDCSYN